MTEITRQGYRLGYRADLEGLRALAILLVVAVHAGLPWLSGGFIGVDVFFVLSGFLITGLLTHEITNTGKLRFAEFYVRRLRRLLPALLLMLIVVAVLAVLLLAPAAQRGQSSAAAAAALWLSNIHFALARMDYFAPGTETNLFLHTWSLGVEEQFYLVWPALLVWLLAKGGARGLARLKAGMLIVAGVSLALCVWLTYAAPQLAFYMMPLRAWQFAAGALVWLYFKTPGREGVTRSIPRIWGWAGLALILIGGFWLRRTMAYPSGWALLPTLGAAGVIAAGCAAGPATGVSRWLAWRPLQSIGHVSYSWYLWHWPILLLGPALAGMDTPGYRILWVVVSLLLACASYVIVESPIRHQRYWLIRPRMAIVGALSVMVLASALCLRWYGHAAEQMSAPEYRRYAAAHVDAPVIYAMGCDDWYHSARVRICAFGPVDAAHTAVLMGDSHAGQWAPAVAEVFNRAGWRMLVLTKSSCPIVDEPYFYGRIGREYTECSTWRADALQRIAAIKPDVVLLGSTTAGFTKQQWIDGTAKVLEKLTESVGHIYLIRDTPHLPFDGPDCLAEHAGKPAWLRRTRACSSPSYQDQYSEQVYAWLKIAAARFTNASMLDMNGAVCPDGVCLAEQHGVVVFRDSQHLTRSFAATLGPVLAKKLGMPAGNLSRQAAKGMSANAGR